MEWLGYDAMDYPTKNTLLYTLARRAGLWLTLPLNAAMIEDMPSTERSSAYEDSGRTGFVYVVTNPHMPGLVKIGATRKHPLQRAKELGAGTGVPAEMRLDYFHDFVDCFAAESMTHDHFAHSRVNESREFFAIGVDEAVRFISGLCNSSTYREAALESVGIEGGEYRERAAYIEAPWAELFKTFDENGGPTLNAEERAKCRALEERLRWKR